MFRTFSVLRILFWSFKIHYAMNVGKTCCGILPSNKSFKNLRMCIYLYIIFKQARDKQERYVHYIKQARDRGYFRNGIG